MNTSISQNVNIPELFETITANLDTQVIRDKGFLVIPFDVLDATVTDVIRNYVSDFLVPSKVRDLMSVRSQAPAGMITAMNVFTDRSYQMFLQMISKEDYLDNRSKHKTMKFVVHKSESYVNVDDLPVIKNDSAGRKLFKSIECSAYSAFSSDALHLVEVHSLVIDKGRKEQFCEYNLYIPKKYLI